MNITRKELRQKPEYQHSLALDKLVMENHFLPEARKYRNSFQIPLEIIGGVGMPIATYYLSKKGLIAPNPDMIRYGCAELIGLTYGWVSGLVLGTLAYETFSKEGEINQFFSRIKKHFTKNN
jgi:hypothetical protein